MAVSPSSGSSPGGDRNPQSRWLRLVVISGGILVAIAVAGTLAARYFVYRRLAPIVETAVGDLIDRPVELGPIDGFSLTGILIDGAEVPPTVEDEDYAKVPKIEVSFNPLHVLSNVVRDRTLPITLTFVDPELYIQQDADGNWVELMIKAPEEDSDPPITLALETIKAKNATLIVAPYPQADTVIAPENQSQSGGDANVQLVQASVQPRANPVVFEDIEAIAHLRDKNRYVEADVSGNAVGGGSFDLTANADTKRPQVEANLQTEAMQVVQFNDLLTALVPLPAKLQTGTLDADLTVEYDKGDKLPFVNGTAQVQDITASSDLAPKPVSDLNALLNFSGQTVTLDQTSLRYDQVEVTASGAVDLNSGYDLAAQVKPITLEALTETADIELPIEASGAVAVAVNITGPIDQPSIAGTLSNPQPIQVDRLVADTVAAEFTLTPTLFTLQQLSIIPAVGGRITGNGQVNLGNNIGLLLDMAVADIPTDAIANLYDITLPAPTQLGQLNSTIEVFGDLDDLQAVLEWNVTGGTFPAQGNLAYGDQVLRVRNTIVQVEPGAVPNFAGVEGTLTANANAFLAEERWDAQVNVEGIDLSAVVPQVERGRVSSNLDLTGTLDRANVVGTVTLSDGLTGTVTTTANAVLSEKRWDAQVNIDSLAINPLVSQAEGQLTSDLSLTGAFDQLTPDAVNIAGTTTLANALITLSDDTPPILDRGDWTTTFQWLGDGLAVEEFVAPGIRADGLIAANLQGDLTLDAIVEDINLNVAVAPYDLNRLQAFVPADIKTQLDAQIAPFTDVSVYPGGFVQFQGQITGNLAQLQLDGTTQLDNLAIANLAFAPTLSGPVNFGLGQGGAVDLTGGGDRIYARLDERYLPTNFEIRASEFVAAGTLEEGDRLTAAIENFNVTSLDIRPLPRPDLGPVQGRVNLNLAANLTDLTNPQVEGKVAIAQPGLGTVAANVFTGSFNYGDGIASLTDGFFCIGPGDLNPNSSTEETAAIPSATPTSASTSGLDSISLDSTSPDSTSPDSTRSEPPTATELCTDTSTFRLAAVIDVFNLAVQSSQLVIEEAHVQDFLTTLRWFDIDDAVQWLNLNSPTLATSLGTSEDIDLEAIALADAPLIFTEPNAPLVAPDSSSPLRNLEAIAEGQLPDFNQWLSQWQRGRSTPQFILPTLEALDGQLDGIISLTGSLNDGFAVDFDLEGEAWHWAPYLDDGRFTAKGNATPEIVTFDQFQLTTENALVALNGQIGLTQPGTSTLVVNNVPIPLLQTLAQQFVPQLQELPVALDGTLETNITLAGTVFAPTVDGVVRVDQPVFNQQPLERVAMQFGYNQTDLNPDNQARLTLDGAIVFKDEERLSLTGDVPYAPSFMAIQPVTDQIAINVNIRDEGFKLINLFTQGQVTWEGGTGVLDAGVNGTLARPQIGGRLTLQDGQLSSPFLTQPITGIAGASTFNLSRIAITDPFVAQLGNGNVVISGQLPVFFPIPALDSAATNELAIALNTLPLPLKNLLSAKVDGNITVGGTAIAPVIGGTVNVADGQVDVAGVLAAAGGNANNTQDSSNPESSNNQASSNQASGNQASSSDTEPTPNPALDRIQLDQLAIVLSNEFQIARNPLFDLEVLGGFKLDGTLAQPTADGDIELSSGWINLFATQFRVDRSETNRVSFRPDRSLVNPNLDVVMRATVREVDRQPVPPSSPFANGEVADQSSTPTFGGLQTVIITATVDGSAQNLLDHLTDPNSSSRNPLTLTSDPERSKQQIVALLGGEVFTALGSGNAGLAIASYVGSGFAADLGNQVADALGLSEFSIFPTTDVSGESRLPVTIGIEAAIDIIPRSLSFSMLEVLDGNTNPQLGLRYQLTDRWQLRGSTDLNDDSRAIVEFRTDF